MVAGVFEPAPGGRVYNTAVAFDAEGRLAAAYRKIHLFDALGQRESDQVAPGDEPVVTELGGLRVGILTCYDIRFPELARALVARGADLIVVPAGWAAGLFKEEHWVTLVRARAIENTVWVAAADQVPDPAEPATPRAHRGRAQHAGRPDGHGQAGPRVAAGHRRGRGGHRADGRDPGGPAGLEHRRDDVFGRP